MITLRRVMMMITVIMITIRDYEMAMLARYVISGRVMAVLWAGYRPLLLGAWFGVSLCWWYQYNIMSLSFVFQSSMCLCSSTSSYKRYAFPLESDFPGNAGIGRLSARWSHKIRTKLHPLADQAGNPKTSFLETKMYSLWVWSTKYF